MEYREVDLLKAELVPPRAIGGLYSDHSSDCPQMDSAYWKNDQTLR